MCPSDECSSPRTAQGDVHSIPFSTTICSLLPVHVALDLALTYVLTHMLCDMNRVGRPPGWCPVVRATSGCGA